MSWLLTSSDWFKFCANAAVLWIPLHVSLTLLTYRSFHFCLSESPKWYYFPKVIVILSSTHTTWNYLFSHILASLIHFSSIKFLISFSCFVSDYFFREHLSLSLPLFFFLIHSLELFMPCLFLNFLMCIGFLTELEKKTWA